MRARHVLLAAGMVVAAYHAFFGDKAPTSGIAEPVARKNTASRAPVAAPLTSTSTRSNTSAGQNQAPVIHALVPRETLIGGAHVDKPAEGLFGSQSWTPPPPPPPKAPPPAPPTAPTLPFTYLGKKVEDGNWEVYLGRGDQTLIVRSPSVIEGTYRVDSIKPPTMTLTYLPLNQEQTLSIGGID